MFELITDDGSEFFTTLAEARNRAEDLGGFTLVEIVDEDCTTVAVYSNGREVPQV